MDTVNGIELTEAGTPSHILRDLSEYATLAFIASFDVPQAHKHDAEPSIATQASDSITTAPQRKRITYIALAKMCMPKLAELFLRFKDKDEIFVNESVDAVLSAYAVPIKLKYECPDAKYEFGVSVRERVLRKRPMQGHRYNSVIRARGHELYIFT